MKVRGRRRDQEARQLFEAPVRLALASAWCRGRSATTMPKSCSAREPFGRIIVDDEDDERSYNFEKSIPQLEDS